MRVVLFRSRKTDAADSDEYRAALAEMLERARRAPGFVDFRAYAPAEGDETLSVIWWRDAETLRAWREDERHRFAQRRGREDWYAWYRLEVAEIVRESEFER